MTKKSQANQDSWVCFILENKKNGYFIDLGAHNGIFISNTYHLEKSLGWGGICVEPNKELYKELVKNRSCNCLSAAVSGKDGFCNYSPKKEKIEDEGIKVPCYTLETILNKFNSPEKIDYLSIDIEGHEMEVLKNFNFSSKWEILLVTVEHNLYFMGDSLKNDLHSLLFKNGFTRVVEDVSDQWGRPFEDWYISNKLLSLPEISARVKHWNENTK